MKPKILMVNGKCHEKTIDIVTEMRLIVSRKTKWGMLCGRWGVNRQALKNFEKKLKKGVK